jgi:hypothetical protein
MPRAISQSFRTAAFAENSGDVPLLFAELTHPDWATPFRFVSDTSDYIWQGRTYLGAMFDVEIVSDTDQPPTARFVFPNIDTEVGRVIESTVSPPMIRLDIISSAFFNLTVNPRLPLGGVQPAAEYSASNMWISDISVDAIQVAGRISSLDITREGAHKFRCTKERTPALFR